MDRTGKYVARNWVFLSGKRHAPGSEVHLSHEDAERAIAQGTVHPERVDQPAESPEPEAESAPAPAITSGTPSAPEPAKGATFKATPGKRNQ